MKGILRERSLQWLGQVLWKYHQCVSQQPQDNHYVYQLHSFTALWPVPNTLFGDRCMCENTLLHQVQRLGSKSTFSGSQVRCLTPPCHTKAYLLELYQKLIFIIWPSTTIPIFQQPNTNIDSHLKNTIFGLKNSVNNSIVSNNQDLEMVLIFSPEWVTPNSKK